MPVSAPDISIADSRAIAKRETAHRSCVLGDLIGAVAGTALHVPSNQRITLGFDAEKRLNGRIGIDQIAGFRVVDPTQFGGGFVHACN